MNPANVFTILVPEGISSDGLIEYFNGMEEVLYAEEGGGVQFDVDALRMAAVHVSIMTNGTWKTR